MVDGFPSCAVEPVRAREQGARPVRGRARFAQGGAALGARFAVPAGRHEDEDDVVAGRRGPAPSAPTGPTSSTMPAASWPNAIGSGRGRLPLITDRSEWHSPAALIRTSTSPGPGGSSSSVSIVSGLDAA